MKKLILFTFALGLIVISCAPKTKPQSMKEGANHNFADNGPNPFVFDVEEYTKSNNHYRTTIWTGANMQMTLMALQPGEDIGLEIHLEHDQFLRVEEGRGVIKMGDSKENLTFEKEIDDDMGVFIPAGKWHNLYNTGDEVMKLYSIYAPIEHSHGTIHQTRREAMESDTH